MMYKLYKAGINGELDAARSVGVEPQVSFVFDEQNPDYQAYLRWCEEGNTPQGADE